MRTHKTLPAALLACAAMAATASVHAQSFVDGFLQNFSDGQEIWVGYQSGPDTSDSLAWNTSTGATGQGGGYIGGGPTCGSACLGITAMGSGNVTNGSLGVSVVATFPQAADSAITAETYAQYPDSLTITNGNGSGVLELAYTVDGSFSESSAQESTCNVFFTAACNEINAGLVAAPTGTTVSVSLGGVVADEPLGEFPLVSGYQTDSVTLDIPFTYGSTFSIEPYLAADSSITDTTALPYNSDIEFDDTMALDSAVVYSGTPGDLIENPAADISATSGLLYGPNGVTAAVPETGGLMLLAGGLALLLGRRVKIRS